jgi:hypothetical protein
MRYTKQEKEQIYNAICCYDDLAQEGRTDRTPDEVKVLHSAFLKMRMELRGY